MARGVAPDGIEPEPITIFVGMKREPTWLWASRILPLSVTALVEKTPIVTRSYS